MRSSKGQYLLGAGLVLVSLALASLTVYVGTLRPPNTLAAAILQAGTILSGTFTAWVFARASVQSAARELIRPHARSAFRRVRNIYQALGRLLRELDRQSLVLFDLRTEGSPNDTIGYEYVDMTMQHLKQLVIAQVSTVDDALADWRDLVPEDVRQIEDEARRLQGDEDAD